MISRIGTITNDEEYQYALAAYGKAAADSMVGFEYDVNPNFITESAGSAAAKAAASTGKGMLDPTKPASNSPYNWFAPENVLGKFGWGQLGATLITGGMKYVNSRDSLEETKRSNRVKEEKLAYANLAQAIGANNQVNEVTRYSKFGRGNSNSHYATGAAVRATPYKRIPEIYKNIG